MKSVLLVILLTMSTCTLAQSQEIRSRILYPISDSGIGLTSVSYFNRSVSTFYPQALFYWWSPWYPYAYFPLSEELPWVKDRIVYPLPGYRQPTDLEEAPVWTPAEREVYDWEGTFRPAEPDPLIRKAINPRATDPARDGIILSPEPHEQERLGREEVDQPDPRRRVRGQDRRTQQPFSFPDR